MALPVVLATGLLALCLPAGARGYTQQAGPGGRPAVAGAPVAPTLHQAQAPAVGATVSDPAPTVPAGWVATEAVTVTSLDGASHDVGIFLSGPPDLGGQPTKPDGFSMDEASLLVPAGGSNTTPPLAVVVQGTVQPGVYDLNVVVKDNPLVFVPVQVTVTAEAPAAHAIVAAGDKVTLPWTADEVDAGTPISDRQWDVYVSDDYPLPVPGVTIDLGALKGSFTPPPPAHVGPQDVTGQKGPEILRVPFSTTDAPAGTLANLDVLREVPGNNWSVAPGDTQSVTVTLTPTAPFESIGLKMEPGDWDSRPYGTFGAPVVSDGDQQQGGDQIVWQVFNPTVGTPYTLTVPITATATGTFKPAIYAFGIESQSSSWQGPAQTASATDTDLSNAPVQFGSSATTLWLVDQSHNVDLRLDGLSPPPSPPPPEVTVQSWATTAQGIPVVFDHGAPTFALDTTGDCALSLVQKVGFTLDLGQAGGGTVSLDLTRIGLGPVWSGAVPIPTGTHGYATLGFDVTCADTTVEHVDGGAVYIDPSGTVVDSCTRAPVAGATVTLESETAPSVFDPPLAGSFVPAVNPEVTGADGLYGWDVIPGLWRVRVQAPGYTAADSPVLTIPPAVTDLTIALTPLGGCDTTPPAIAPHGSVAITTSYPAGVAVPYVPPAATDDRDGPVAVTCTPASGSRFAVGTTTVVCTATDRAGNRAQSSFRVVVTLLTASTATCTGVFSGTWRDLVVPAGAVCTLLPGTSIAHDATVRSGGTLDASSATFGHDLTIAGAGSVCSSTVGHDLTVQGASGPVAIGGAGCGNAVGHDLTLQGNAPAVSAVGNTIGHDLVVQSNRPGGATVSGNRAGHDAVCQSNSPQSGSGNTAGHSLRCP